MNLSKFTVIPVDDRNRQTAVEFLQAHEETAQFLLNNLSEYGPVLTAHHNSGNFKAVYQSGKVVGVFCLTRRGNLLVQASGEAASIILQSCAQESLVLKGFLGDWNSVEPILHQYRTDHPEFKPSYESKEILYRYNLKPDDYRLKHDSRVRLLRPDDFELWNPLNLEYLEELKLPSELNIEARRGDFIKRVAEKVRWGLFLGDQLASIAALNSKGDGIGQVGGVFTPVKFRKQGFSKATMFHMLADCRDIHLHRRSILFTGEKDFAARKLYESMGYQRIGYFALVLSGG